MHFLLQENTRYEHEIMRVSVLNNIKIREHNAKTLVTKI